MIALKYRAKAPEVFTLCEMLHKIGYSLKITDSFTLEVDAAVKDFQKKNNLVMDGIVGMKTWQVLFDKSSKIFNINDLFLSEQDLKDFAKSYNLELAAVKAVNEVESCGKGFLINGKPKILFEGHVFWQQLQKRGIKPESLANPQNRNVLYPKWTKVFYKGGVQEYDRLNQAIAISPDPLVKEAALASASWGSFQIMGYHAKSLGYASVQAFVDKMYLHEREHLKAFGKFLEVNNILTYLRNKNWAKVAEKYNGAAYRKNKYDEKLKKAYEKYA
ncbi:N-acetylmuramidase domain-containing protein [Kaistella palustris]|uniref:N-acetylmuramidase domain-containing protein n=1 Tax=Kaistella palustris TaxID=493376 RepID=UPI0004039246|nr:N-acetylmuramidase family protein [Kaistella palustris]